MEGILEKAAVKRFIQAANDLGVTGQVTVLAETARTAVDAANGLGIKSDRSLLHLSLNCPPEIRS